MLDIGSTLFFTVQAASIVPSPPPGRTVVGQGYWLRSSENAPALSAASINIGYLGREVPAGEEEGIQIYFWDETVWTALDTDLDIGRNEASVKVIKAGLYVVMSSIRLHLNGPGWNLIAYPAPGKIAITDALRSIEGAYTTVYHYDLTDPVNQWRVYDVGAPSWVNDLKELAFGQGYWIYITSTRTLYVSNISPISIQTTADASGGLPYPPATYYTILSPSPGFNPAPGIVVEARIGTSLYG